MARIPREGEKVFIKNIPQYSSPNGKICTITRTGLGMVWVKPKHWRGEDLEIDEEDIEYTEPESFTPAERKELVKRLVKQETLQDPKNLILELANIKKLIAKYPNLDFWRGFKPLFQVKSLLWFFGGGKNDLRFAYNEKTLDLSVPKTENANIGTEKIGEDVVINKKPKSIMDL